MSGVEPSELLPFAISLVSAVVISTLAIFRKSRSLRRDVAADIQVLPHLKGRARLLMAESVHRRSIQTVAFTRYPVLTRFDVLCLIGLVAIVAATAWMTYRATPLTEQKIRGWVLPPIEPLSPMVLFGFPLLLVIYTSWVQLATGRLDLLVSNDLDEEAQDEARLQRLWLGVVVFLCTAVVAAVFGWTAYAMAWMFEAPDGVMALVTALAVICTALFGMNHFYASPLQKRTNKILKITESAVAPYLDAERARAEKKRAKAERKKRTERQSGRRGAPPDAAEDTPVAPPTSEV